jgi:hypothetical protein
MKPYIICHMLSSVDGKIDGAALGAVMDEAEYEATAAKLKGDAWICGRATMQQHFAEDEPFVSASNTPAGPRPSLSFDEQHPMPSPLIRSASYGAGRSVDSPFTSSLVV